MKTFTIIILSLFIFTQRAITQVDTSIYNLSLIDLAKIKISTPGRNIMTVLTAPSNIITITHQEIEQNNYTCLRDLLNDIPQIIIQHRSSAEDEDIYVANGIPGNERLLILMDGIRINSAAGTDVTIGQSYSLENIKQVEIILNPSSVLYGADAFSAIVNLITYKPNENPGTQLHINRGNFNTTLGSFCSNFSLKKLGISLVSKYYYSDEPFMPLYYPDIYSWYYRYEKTGEVVNFLDTIPAPIGIKPWDMHTRSANLRAKITYQNLELGIMSFYESHSTSMTSPPQFTIYSKEAHYYTRLDNIYIKHHYTNRSCTFSIKTLINTQQFKILPQSAFINRYTNFNIAYKYENARNLHWEENLKYTGLKNHTFNLGTALDLYDVIPKTGDLPIPYDESRPYNQQNIYYFGTNVTDSAGNSLVIYQDIYRIKYFNISTYAQATHFFATNTYVIIGIRGEYNSRYGFALLPRASVVFTPSNYLSLKLIYGKSFLAPSVHKAYQQFGAFIPLTDSLGHIIGLQSPFWRLTSPELKPEYKDSYEIAITSFINENFYIKANAFFNQLYNLITRVTVYDTVFHNIPVQRAWVLKNTGHGQSYGGTINLTKLFKINELKFKYSLNYTYTNGHIQDLPLQFSPKHSVKTKLTISYLDEMNISLSGEYRSSAYFSHTVYSPPFFVLNAAGNALLIEKKYFRLWFTYRATNLLSSHYFNLSDGSIGPSPQKTFFLLIGFKARF